VAETGELIGGYQARQVWAVLSAPAFLISALQRTADAGCRARRGAQSAGYTLAGLRAPISTLFELKAYGKSSAARVNANIADQSE
jgi:hypothetical protein